MSHRMSCSMTVDSVRDESKTVTRRHVDTWKNLKPGDRVTLIEKGMGLPKGAKQVVLAEVEIVDVRVEPLSAVTPAECAAEGLPMYSPFEFQAMWMSGHGYSLPEDEKAVNRIMCRRIEWRYLPAAATDTDAYEDLLRAKVTFDNACGYDITDDEIHPRLFPHQRDIVRWAVHGGRRAMFTSFGTGKSNIQLEVCRLTRARAGGRALIVCPLGVRQEFKRDADLLGQSSRFVRWSTEVLDTDPTEEPDIWLTNYESIRDGRLDPELFTVISLDEGAVLRSLGTKTFQTFRTLCDQVPHRFVATATPSPNEHTELTNYADFLGVLDRGQSLTRWFKRNSTKAGELTLMPHRAPEFWAWVSTWSVWLQQPSDLGYSDEGYTLPDIDVRYHEIEVDALGSLTFENQGQGVLVRDGALGVIGASKEKRDSISARVAKAAELVAQDPDDHFILWHHLESERQQITRQIPGVCEVFGSLDLEERERRIIAFSDGQERLLATKPSLSGSGCNFQRHCHRAIFVGIDFKFADFVQAIHRIQRFGQNTPVRIDIIHADTERQVVAELNRKWKQHKEMTANMSKLIQEHGLSQQALTESLARSIGTQRVAASGEGWEIVNDDTVRETRRMNTDSVDLIWSSPPYGTQYEYVAAVEDFGHNDDNDAFWAQMDHLTPELHRVLKPGRMCIFHTKDRIRFGNMNGRGYATVQPFAAEAIMHMIRHGFGYLGEITLDTDVVRENNQTYRLGWSEVVKDRTKLGVGTPEKILLFRKNQTDRTTGTADDPVTKTKDDYTLARWQIDAAAFWKSSGDRFITPEELEGLPVPVLRKVFAAACESRIYDYEAHVALGDDFASRQRLPTTFAMLAPTTESPVVWTEVNRLQSLNTSQARKGAELHVCPTPFDVVDRCINQWSNLGDLVFDPFGGLGTAVTRALKLGRRGKCNELNPLYWADAVKYAQAMENQVNMPSLFDALDTVITTATDVDEPAA